MNNGFRIMQMLDQIKSNPEKFVAQYGIPKELSNSPQGIIQAMLNNGQITQDQYNQGVQKVQSMGFKLN